MTEAEASKTDDPEAVQSGSKFNCTYLCTLCPVTLPLLHAHMQYHGQP